MFSRHILFAASLFLSSTAAMAGSPGTVPSAETGRANNLVLFVADGLRSVMVQPQLTPTLAALRDQGVFFKNSHSLFPTLTTANASTIATGHNLGDTGNFGNRLYAGFPLASAKQSVVAGIANNAVQAELDEHYDGNYLNETSLLTAAHSSGYNTASIGKLGAVLLFTHTTRDGQTTVVVDDGTGKPNGIPLAPWLAQGIQAAGLPLVAPSRGANGDAGKADKPGTLETNAKQQNWFVDVLTRVVLPKFKQEGKPFAIVFWSLDPDGTQHNQGDSHLTLEPGINGPTSLAAIANADSNLQRIRAVLNELGLADNTNIVVTSDHGFSTISKQSATSQAAKASYANVPAGHLPHGFLALDLAAALQLPAWDPDNGYSAIDSGKFSRKGGAVLGSEPQKPQVIVVANGGSDLIYLPQKGAKKLARKIMKSLLQQDYVSGVFVDEALGRFPGALTLKDINLHGTSKTPRPSIVVSFRSFSTGCKEPLACTVVVADTELQQGQGMHGSFSRADTYNFTAASGPDFKQDFIDEAPVSNADVGKTLAHLLHLKIDDIGSLSGRVMSEALVGGSMPLYKTKTLKSAPSAQGLRTVLKYQEVGKNRYFDAAGFPGRTVGLDNSGLKANP